MKKEWSSPKVEVLSVSMTFKFHDKKPPKNPDPVNPDLPQDPLDS
ncbi:paeninodin family lasso peptide [Alkalihalobacillus sp. LMS39]|nr:paeninodin family lasso peptide [Alkalihalobacillus sp. LMS39]UOE94073.1 paeninodin family lasso peptide [Alkalihalobacillus sp. LMS39]